MLRAANTRVVNHDTPSIRTHLPDRPCYFHSHAPEMSNLTTCAANTARPRTMPMPADEGDQHRVIVDADTPAGLAKHKTLNVDRHRPLQPHRNRQFPRRSTAHTGSASAVRTRDVHQLRPLGGGDSDPRRSAKLGHSCLRECLRTAMGGRVPRGEPKMLAPGWVGDYQVPAQTRSPQCHHRRSRHALVRARPTRRADMVVRVLVVGDRRTVGDPRTAVACAGQHGRPRRTTREALPPCDSGRHPVHRARWYRVAATAWSSRQPRRCTRSSPAGPAAERGSASSTRCATDCGCGPGGTGPDRGDHRLADGTRRRHRAPIQPRLGWRQENERRQAAPRRGCERPAAHRRRHRRLDPRPRRRTPTPGRTARQLSTIGLVWADGGYLGRLLIWAKDVLTLTMQIIKRLPGATGFHVRPRIWVVEEVSRGSTTRRCARDYETRPDHHEAMVHLAMITTMTRRLAILTVFKHPLGSPIPALIVLAWPSC